MSISLIVSLTFIASLVLTPILVKFFGDIDHLGAVRKFGIIMGTTVLAFMVITLTSFMLLLMYAFFH